MLMVIQIQCIVCVPQSDWLEWLICTLMKAVQYKLCFQILYTFIDDGVRFPFTDLLQS